MKKLLLINLFLITFLTSCSSECEYERDNAEIVRITSEMDELDDKIEETTLQSLKDAYHNELNQLQAELDNAVVGECK